MTRDPAGSPAAAPERTPLAVAWPFIRIAFAAMIAAAIIAQLMRTLSIAAESTTPHGSHLPTVVANFFSFFTIQSNVGAAVVLVIGAVSAWTSTQRQDPRWLAILLSCVTTYMLVTGVVYNTLLRGVALPQGSTVPWSNEILHVVGPLALLLDLLLAPRRRPLGWGAVWAIIAFPLVWVAYTMLRANLVIAPATGDPWWYPYPFLDPHSPATGGVAGVVAYILGIAVAIGAAGILTVWIGRRVARPRPAPAAPALARRP